MTEAAKVLISELTKMDGISVSKATNGTNIYDMKLAKEINLKTLANYLYKEHAMWIPRANEEGIIKFTINESLVSRPMTEVIKAWQIGITKAKQ